MLRLARHRSAALVRFNSTKKQIENPLSVAFKTNDEDEDQDRYRLQKNPVVPSLSNLTTRWSKMDAGQQDDIIAYLEDKMRGSWHDLTAEEKKASHWVWYGNWGPRNPNQRDMGNLYLYFGGCLALMGGGLGLYKYSTYDETEEIPGIEY